MASRPRTSIPRYVDDAAPGRPLPSEAWAHGERHPFPARELRAEVEALRALAEAACDSRSARAQWCRVVVSPTDSGRLFGCDESKGREIQDASSVGKATGGECLDVLFG